MEKTILLNDFAEIKDSIEGRIIKNRLNAGPKGTKIIMTDHDSGKILGEYENKIVITGSQLNACKIFNLEPEVIFPDYNRELELDNTLDYSVVKPKNEPFVCLFCIGDSGCGTESKDVFKASFTDRIEPVDDIIPFRYVDPNHDLNKDLRKYYFGRKELPLENRIAYYFKSFDTHPQLHLRYTDGTQITKDVYNIQTEQAAECYVQMRLRVTRTDFRDYFEQVRGWDKARISTLSLCFAWYDDTIDDYKWYQQIQPYSKLNFSYEYLVDLTKAIDFQYNVYY